MALFKFSYRNHNPKHPISHLKRTWACQDMDEAVKAARTLNMGIKSASVYRVEDIKSGETVEL